MTREILFRGKRKDNGEWVYGAYFNLHHNDDRTHLHHFIIPNNTPIPKDKPIGEIQVEVIPETVGQYTGLTDKNGKRIWEGDVITDFRGEYSYVVCFGECELEVINFYCRHHGAKNPHKAYGLYAKPISGSKFGNGLFENNESLEVIGNIHDNPELLTVK